MIPVVIAPAYNRHDLLQRMLESIDVDVDRALVIDNGRNDPMLDYHRLQRVSPRVFRPPFSSLGYGGSINFGIRQTADAPWWFWSSNDVVFHPGHLQTVVDRMTAVASPRIITGGCTWGAVNRAAWDAVGEWDEWSFFPIYYDDNDWHRRADLAGVEWIEDWATGSTHGEPGRGASVTIADPAANAGNHNSFPENHRRYLEKWGGEPGAEVFTSPWNAGLPVWVTRPDIRGRGARQW